MCGVTLSHQPLDEILVRMHRGTPIPQHKSWIPTSTQITKLYHKEELVEKGRSYTRGKGQQNSVPYTEFCMGGKKVDVYFDCGSSIQSYASLVFLGMHASRKVQSWQKVSHLLE